MRKGAAGALVIHAGLKEAVGTDSELLEGQAPEEEVGRPSQQLDGLGGLGHSSLHLACSCCCNRAIAAST